MSDVDVDDVREAVIIHIPDMLHNHGTAERTSLVPHHVFEDAEFLGRKIDRLVAARHLAPQAVDYQIPHLEAFRLLASHDSFAAALDASHGDVRDLLERLAVEDKQLEDPEGEAALLVGEVARRTLAEGVRDGDPEVVASVAWVRQQEEALTSAATRREALGQLLRWMASRVDEEGP